MIKLVTPHEQYKDSFIQAVLAMKNTLDASSEYKTLAVDWLQSHFADYVKEKLDHSKGINIQEGRVQETTFWIINEHNQYVGRISIRHYLNDFYQKTGGHIGYNIIASERKKGYASEALRLCLIEAKKMNLEKVLITCLEDNWGSKKVIEKNGGVFENTAQRDEKTFLRYWINLL